MEQFPNMDTSIIEEQLFGKLPMTEDEQEEQLTKAEERYNKMCDIQDEGELYGNDWGWD